MKLTATAVLFFSAVMFMTLGHAQNATVAAPTTTPGGVIPVPPDAYHFVNASADLSGVRLSYPVRVIATVYGTTDTICIPANFPLRGLGLLTSSGVPVKLLPDDPRDATFGKFTPCDNSGKDDEKIAKLRSMAGRALIVSEEDTKMYTLRSSGLTYGILVVPFKYYVNGSRDFKGAGTIGPYAGWKLQSSRIAAGLEKVGFAGLSAVSSEKIVDGKADSETLAAFGYGVAAIGRIRNNFQIGVVLGQDRVGKSSQYKDNGKWWLAMSIG